MKAPRLRIAIVGCGSAGPAAAILLHRQGHEVTLFERAPECRAVGAGFLLQPSGMSVLREIGILNEVISHASRVDRLHVVDAEGDTLLELDYNEITPGLFGAGLHRPVLLHFLIEAMAAEPIDVRWNWDIDQASLANKTWSLRTSDGREACGFDLLIVADGARSKLRDLLAPGASNRGYPWGAHWFIGANRGVFQENELYQLVRGTRRLGGFLATGHELGNNDPLVSLFWSIKIADDEAIRAQPLDAWKEQILDLCPKAETLLSQIQSWDQILTARYGDVRMRRWHGDRVIFLGDAAHAMSPQLGQGVNLALADASCLADCLKSHSLEVAFRHYQRRRTLALRYYQFSTRWLTPWFQSDHEWLSPVRKALFGLSHRMAWSRKMMTLTMAGSIGSKR